MVRATRAALVLLWLARCISGLVSTELYIKVYHTFTISLFNPHNPRVACLRSSIISFCSDDSDQDDLLVDKSNEIANYTIPITIPKETAEGPVTFTTSLFQLYGAANGPTVTDYSGQITLGKETSDEYVTGEYVASKP